MLAAWTNVGKRIELVWRTTQPHTVLIINFEGTLFIQYKMTDDVPSETLKFVILSVASSNTLIEDQTT